MHNEASRLEYFHEPAAGIDLLTGLPQTMQFQTST
jgi:hypothetical protein